MFQQPKPMNTDRFEAIVLEYQKEIFNYTKRVLGSKEDALDATQETFIKLYMHRNSIDPAKSLKSWLYRVATTTSIDIIRKRNRLAEIPYDDEAETNLTDTTYTRVEEEALRKDIDKALESLDERLRAVLLLYYREDFSYQEISEMLDIPLNTTKTYIRRAKIALKKYLEKNEF